MKVLFVDIDGVMNNDELLAQSIHSIGDEFLDRLKFIVEQTNARIVLSSTWRLYPVDLAMVERAFATRNLKLFDCTIEIERGFDLVPRAEEIEEWLTRFPDCEKFAILDDWSDAGIGFKDSFFQTDMKDGLTEEIAQKVILHLNNLDTNPQKNVACESC